jgi:hypothetical protein
MHRSTVITDSQMGALEDPGGFGQTEATPQVNNLRFGENLLWKRIIFGADDAYLCFGVFGRNHFRQVTVVRPALMSPFRLVLCAGDKTYPQIRLRDFGAGFLYGYIQRRDRPLVSQGPEHIEDVLSFGFQKVLSMSDSWLVDPTEIT